MPHPICHPRGHSYLPREQRLPRLARLDPRRFAACGDYIFGVDLYNHGFFWEAHEAWEACWRSMPASDPHERQLRGLIQAAASLLKISVGQSHGACSLGNRAMSYLRASSIQLDASHVLGLESKTYAEAFERYLRACLAEASPRHDPKLFPYLRIATGPRSRRG